jgi:molybdopterin converting factor small subunit
MADGYEVVIELYGVPRLRAGVGEVAVTAATVREALRELERNCPGLAGLLGPGGRLAPQYLLSIDGREFVAELSRPVRAGERLVLLTADAGG